MEDVTTMNWKCYDCNMTFSNPSMLQKHKGRFCVGGFGDPEHLMLRRGFRSDHYPRDDRESNDESDQPRYNPQTDPKVKQLAENHGRHMEHLQSQNRDLERQREEIRRRLNDLGRRPLKEDDSMNALLQELKDQEARNQKMLEELRRLLANQPQPVYIPPPQAESKRSHLIYPIYYGNSLVAEIIAVRQAYVQNGGNDPDILQQLAQMQAEAQAIDDSLRNRPVEKTKDRQNPNNNFFALELENERLQRQLLLLQEQNLQAKQRRKDDREGRPTSTRLTHLQPLDIKPRPTKAALAIRELRITGIDPFKERIDCDLQNRFGYDLGGSKFFLTTHKAPNKKEGQEGGNARPDVGIGTLVPERSGDIVELKKESDEKKDFDDENTSGLPYFKNHLTSRKLNIVERDLRDSYSRMSEPNAKAEDIEMLDKRKQIISKHPTSQSVTFADSVKHEKKPTEFEDEFFINTSRTEDEHFAPENEQVETNELRARPAPFPRPRILVNDVPVKKSKSMK